MKLDFIKRNLKLVLDLLLPSLSPFARWPAEVIQQNADFSLDVKVDDPRVASTTNLKIKHGIPGVKVTVAPGARVLLGFEQGDPRRPFVELWESGSVTKMEINATEIVFNNGTKKVAREDDTIGTLAGSSPSGPVTFTYTPTGGAPIVNAVVTLKIATGANGVKA